MDFFAQTDTIPGMQKERIKKWAIGLAKLAFSLGAVAFIIMEADGAELKSYIKRLDWGWALAAFLILNIAQFFSALRMRYYFQTIGVPFTVFYAYALYYIGTFFNHVFPGGIGGDGYKAYVLKKQKNLKFSRALQRVLSGRASGLLLLILIALGLAAFSPFVQALPFYGVVLVIIALTTCASYAIAARYLLKEDYAVQLRAAGYSFVVQALVCATAAFLFMGVQGAEVWLGTGQWVDYLMVFMVSCVVSVLPISQGGMGLRELTYFYAAPFIGLNQELGVAVALLYFAVNLLASLQGVLFLWVLPRLHGRG